MNSDPIANAVKKLADVRPFPFYLEQSNHRCVWVKDNRGITVFLESFTDFPDEFTANDRESVIETAKAVANLLMTVSNL